MPSNENTPAAKPMKPGTLKALRAKEWAKEKARLRQKAQEKWAQWKVIAEQKMLNGDNSDPDRG